MPKTLLFAVVAVVALTVAAVGFVAYRSWFGQGDAPTAVVASQAGGSAGQEAETDDPTASAGRRAPRGTGRPRPAAGVRAAPGDDFVAASVENAAPQPRQAVPLEGLDPQGKGTVMLAASQDRRNAIRLRLPGAMTAKLLANANDAAVRLNEQQARQVSDIDAEMKPAIDETLGRNMASQEALRRQMAVAAEHDNMKDHLAMLRNQYKQTLELERQIRVKLNEEYKTKLAEVLRPDQLRFVTEPMTAEMRLQLYGPDFDDPNQGITDNSQTDPVEIEVRGYQDKLP